MARLRGRGRAVGGDVVSGGGTGTYDINTAATEIQAGSYALMDTDVRASSTCRSGMRCRIAATVIHVEPEAASVADCGLKALGMDHGNPTIDGAAACCSAPTSTSRSQPRRAAARWATACSCGPRTSTRRSRTTSAMHLADGPGLDAPIVDAWAVDLRGWDV